MSDLRRGLAALALVLAGPAAAAEVAVLPLPFAVEEFRGPGSYLARIAPTADPALRRPGREGPVALAWGAGGAAALTLADGEVSVIPLRGNPSGLGERPADAIPHARQAAEGPIKAYLASPRTDYGHGVLGDSVEAGTLVIEERRPVQAGPGVQKVPVTVTRLEAGPDAVFEDLEPRLADLDGDGVPEILVVRSSKSAGAALVIAGRREGVWRMVAETPAIGTSNRWLNPGPVADFDRNGKPDIVVVRTPHIDGVLQVWTWDGGGLRLLHEKAGYSTHAQGSTALDNAAAADLDGDGTPEIVAPTLDRRAIAILSVGRGIDERARIPLPAPTGRGLAVLGTGRGARIVVALEDGRVAVVKP
ncbi:FG-GAP repeat domain-containing protein [Salinarimonas soli]|uniref:VCBS repeat-containing protein n=1 Tax=Salinarimonas soli TaxID=1638099 RepID=A0A5B2VQZ8_9HYPH|nr:VCBS repeat-containing protein [Salinarimonas soli]KAA2242193.1 VCBS repeat-containing protein [Salinarimonas soli]